MTVTARTVPFTHRYRLTSDQAQTPTVKTQVLSGNGALRLLFDTAPHNDRSRHARVTVERVDMLTALLTTTPAEELIGKLFENMTPERRALLVTDLLGKVRDE